MLFNPLLSIIISSIILLGIPFYSLNNVQNKSDVTRLFLTLRYEKLMAFITKSESRITASSQHVFVDSSHNFSQKIFLNCAITSNRHWFGFNERLTSIVSGSLFLDCVPNHYKISFPVGKSLIKLYRY